MKFTLFTAIVILLCACSPETAQFEKRFHLECSGETVSNGKFKEGNEYLSNANCRSKDFARSGSYSFKLNSSKQFGPTFSLKAIKKGDVIYASVWRKKGGPGGELVIAAEKKLQYKSQAISFKEVGDWQLLTCSLVAGRNYKNVDVYLWNHHKQSVYFDDLTIDCFRKNQKPVNVEEKDVLRITIPQSAMDSIVDFREMALKQRVISSDLKSYFDASIEVEGKSIPVSLRLKGDWTDHLEGDKWSFRIKVRGDNSYQGIKKFSIQDPHTRSFMMEWFGHRVYEKEDVLTTRYQFKVVYVNGENKGVYALEEHFDKRLLEYSNRREGPIVKFDESGMWQGYMDAEKNQTKIKLYPYLEAAEILPFSKKRTRRIPELYNQYLLAKSHMERYRNLDRNSQDYIELDKMAKFLALCDVMNATHGLVWHNQRNYLNPLSGRLEPIAFDCFPGDLTVHYELIGIAARWRSDNDYTMIDGLFLNHEFDSLYLNYLKKYSADDYMKDRFKEFESELKHYEKLLRHEYPMFRFDREYFEINRKEVQGKLSKYEQLPTVKRTIKKRNPFGDIEQDVVFDKVALKVNTKHKDSLRSELYFQNYLLHEVEIIGYSTKLNKDVEIPFEHPFKLEAFTHKADSKLIRFDFVPQYIYYKSEIVGDSVLKTKVSKWPPSTLVSSLSEDAILLPTLPIPNSNTVRLKKGKYTFSKDVYVPRGKKLVIEAGTSINLLNGARFVSYSPVDMNGSKDKRISIYSSNGSGCGVVLLPEKQKVKLSYVDFRNLKSMNKQNWTLTGAVTVYEAQVDISNCTFSNNKCEDALNLIRCDFVVDSSEIKNTLSDGFDADFCTGTLKNSKFLNTGNDCIDFSGSTISIVHCSIIGSGDKGISGGERSSLVVKDCSIEKASIAIASKDMSEVQVENTSIEHCSFAFAAYRKKAEFGPAKIHVKSVQINDVKENYLIELNSTVKINGITKVGKSRFDIDSMYSAFSK